MNSLELKELRKKLQLTQSELATILGVDIKTVQNWEAGRTIPKSKDGILRKLESNQHIVIGGQHVQNGDAINGDKVVGESKELERSAQITDGDSSALMAALSELTEMRKLLASALETNQRTNDRLLTLLENVCIKE